MRYYISRRLVTDRRRKHPYAWRLPARDMETGIARILREYLSKPATLTDLVDDLSASELPALQKKLKQMASDCDPDGSTEACAPLLRRADIAPGRIALRLDRKELVARLGLEPDRIDSQGRRITAPIQMQRRGDEAKVLLGAATPRIDPVLPKNIQPARRWYDAIKGGASFSALAACEQTTSSRIQQTIGLAFLAPELLEQIAAGTQPLPFTSEWVKRRQVPADWRAQRGIVGAL